MSDKYGYDFIFTKEQHEANNRVDINVKSKDKNSYEVQIECKKDINNELMSGIEKQLIDKYLLTTKICGIYLVFYFGERGNIYNLQEELNNRIPKKYNTRVSIVIIDLML